MKESPILMSGPLVRAVLAGRKTQTRRLIAPAPLPPFMPQRSAGPRGPEIAFGPANRRENGGLRWWRCPYGAPGDRLWVRETFEYVHPCQIADGRYSQPCTAGIPGPPPVTFRTIYRADGPYPGTARIDGYPYHVADLHTTDELTRGDTWTPSIHMPRRDSRLTLDVTEIRVERLQDISEEDARAEGVEQAPDGRWYGATRQAGTRGPPVAIVYATACAAFADLWDAVSGDRATWASNPWVWAVSFRRVC